MRSPVLSVLVVAVLASFAGPAHAHLDLLSPPPRTTMLKQGPCGAGPNDLRGPTVATYAPGETITITWNEYVDHPGHYRVALDEDGQDGFFEPAAFDDQSGGPGVLMDGIPDKNGGDYSQEITLPNIECDNCVLQVIQMMTDKPPYGDGNDLYYQCADIEIVGEVNATTTTGEPDLTTGEPATTTDTPDPTTGEPATTGTSETPDPTAGPSTTDDTAGGTAGLTGGEQPTGSTGANPTATATATASATDTADTDGGDGESGCGCNSGAGGAGWLALGLLPLLRRRRRG